MLSNLLADLSSLLFPSGCVVCGGDVSGSMHGICTMCRYSIPLTNFWKTEDNPTKEHFAGIIPLVHASSFFYFSHDSQWRSLIHRFKYGGEWRLAESFGRTTTDCTVGGQVVAPNLQRLKGEGVWFENMIASSFRTDRGVLATLSGFCSQPTMSIMKEPQRASHLPSIARSLRREGYRTSYIHGGDLNFTNMASYLYATGFDKLVAYKDLHFDAPTSKWGYADDVLADYFTGHIKEQSEQSAPYFAVWQTLSSHEPFDVPTAVFEDKMLSSMHFADSCIGRVVESLRQSEEWDNTLIIIVADHAYPYPYGISASAVERHRIPMLWLGGALKGQKRVDSYCSQSDFAATLLAQLDIAHSDFLLSRDIFAPNPYKFGYYTFNNGFGVVDTTGSTIYDCTTESVILEGSTEQEQIGKTMLQSTYNIIKQL